MGGAVWPPLASTLAGGGQVTSSRFLLAAKEAKTRRVRRRAGHDSLASRRSMSMFVGLIVHRTLPLFTYYLKWLVVGNIFTSSP